MNPNFILDEHSAWDLLEGRPDAFNQLSLYVFLILTKKETDMPEFLEIKITDICEFFSCTKSNVLFVLKALAENGYISFLLSANKKNASIRIFRKI